MKHETKIRAHCERRHVSPACAARKKITFGIFLVAAGVLLILGRSGFIKPEIMDYIFSWQSLLVSLGLLFLISNPRSYVFSTLLILTGSFFLYAQIAQLPVETRNIFWPLVLVLIGLLMIFKRLNKPHPQKRFENYDTNSEDFIERNLVFGESKTVVTSKNFKGGNIKTVFGGCEIILTDAELAEGTQVIELSTVFGGISIIAPRHWDISIEVDGVMGGFKDERHFINQDNLDKTRKLIIRGSAVFGGGELKNS